MRAHSRRVALFATLAFAAALSRVSAEQLNTGTPPRHGMAACPVGQFVVGVHVGDNKLLCAARLGSNYTEAAEKVDATFTDQSMRACPFGTAMTGLHAANNQLLCAPATQDIRIADIHTQRQGMHACPLQTIAVGIDVPQNLLLCADPVPRLPRRELVSDVLQRHGMLSCPESTFAVGIHIGGNKLLCATLYGGYQASSEVASPPGSGSGTPAAAQFPDTHVCPDRMAITGVDIGNNTFMCAPVSTDGPAPRIRDTGTQRAGMHACPPGLPLAGINAGKNELICGATVN